VTTHTVGRPRDPLLDERVYVAACDLYGRKGWAGFSVEALARESGVGKASIYLRWADKASLLLEALTSQVLLPEDVDTGTVRGDLRELALYNLRMYRGPAGNAALRLMAEGRLVPEIAPRWQAIQDAHVLTVRRIVRRGIRRRDLPRGTPVTLVLDALFGGLLMHVQTTPSAEEDGLRRQMEDYADRLVGFVLSAVGAVKRTI
jgi:AcrR family transcriptional regulator